MAGATLYAFWLKTVVAVFNGDIHDDKGCFVHRHDLHIGIGNRSTQWSCTCAKLDADTISTAPFRSFTLGNGRRRSRLGVWPLVLLFADSSPSEYDTAKISMSVVASTCIDANFTVLFPYVPFEASPNYHSIFAFREGPIYWYPRVYFGYSFLYWVICSTMIIWLTYRFAARIDFRNQRVR